ncbi:hypothetical protein GW17_00014566 [Ensete ventricosum]|nr:hypothetical protein GW17_00014566 [Ensete ventricosum]
MSGTYRFDRGPVWVEHTELSVCLTVPCSAESDDQYLDVINAFLKPKCHSADSEAVKRIAEYMEKKAEVKQQKRRPRRLTKAMVNEIDLQLHGLLLSIESQSNAPPETANCLPPPSAAPEVIDLCSPSPPLRTCQVAKCQKSIDMHVNVIDIHESDSDASPEHERKARELRLFMDSIREDLY